MEENEKKEEKVPEPAEKLVDTSNFTR